MRRFLLVLMAVLIPALATSAQQAQETQEPRVVTVAPAEPAPAPAPQIVTSSDYTDWQIALGFQVNGVRLHDQTATTNTTFHTGGINAMFVRYFKDWFGLEAQVGTGFGRTAKTTVPNNLVAKQVFIGAGPHFSLRSTKTRLEPWFHADIGWAHLRFTQQAAQAASLNSFGWQAGAGLDYHLNPVMAVRGEGDYVGNHFLGRYTRGYQFVGAFVVNF